MPKWLKAIVVMPGSSISNENSGKSSSRGAKFVQPSGEPAMAVADENTSASVIAKPARAKPRLARTLGSTQLKRAASRSGGRIPGTGLDLESFGGSEACWEVCYDHEIPPRSGTARRKGCVDPP